MTVPSAMMTFSISRFVASVWIVAHGCREPRSPLRSLGIGNSRTLVPRRSGSLAAPARAVSTAAGCGRARDVIIAAASVKALRKLRGARAQWQTLQEFAAWPDRMWTRGLHHFAQLPAALRSAGPVGRSTFYARGASFTLCARAALQLSGCARALRLRRLLHSPICQLMQGGREEWRRDA